MVSAGILEISTKANSRAFTVISSPPPHVKIASSETGVGRRIASLSAVPRIRTNIFPKQLDCIESEKDRQIERIRVRKDGKERRGGEERRGEVQRGRIVPRAMVPSAGTAKGWRIPATPPYVSSYLFLLPVYDAPSSAERRERIEREEERGGGGGGREGGGGGGLSIFIMFAPKKERRREKAKNGSETRWWEYTRGERARRAARKNLQPRELV